MSSKAKRVAVIPAYNEERTIAKVVLKAKRHVDSVIVCDDGSKDMTFTISKALGVKVIRHSENRGKGATLKSLLEEVVRLDPDVIVTLDGDGQHDPDEIPKLLKPIEAGVSDMVVGSRFVEGGEMDAPLYRRFGLHIINLLYRKVAGVRVNDTQSGFRAYSREAFEYLIHCETRGYGIEGEQLVLASRNGLRVNEVPISVNYNGSGKNSKKASWLHGAELLFTLLKLVAHGD